ncbi:MAG TPA: CGNR zinc finger domain-containing protein [Pyrinomonadaceae bacterium]|nr:CGNR zinc finger domain-containing protein [Pyrinomonadaceae bacterium]
MPGAAETKKFKLVGGHPALDFVNTVGGWASDPARRSGRDHRDTVLRDKLETYSDFLALCQQIGLLPATEGNKLLRLAKEQPLAAERMLKRGLQLRVTIYRLFRSVVEHWRPSPGDLASLNDELLLAGKHEQLEAAKVGFSWGWRGETIQLDRPLWSLALSAAELLASAELSRLRQCCGEGCGWMFLDTSRNGRRHWCDMKDCGNLAKVRRFRQRLREK